MAKPHAHKGKPLKVPIKEIMKLVPGSGGILSQIARKAGINRHTMWQYCQRSPELKKAIENEAEVVLDACEYALIKKIYEEDLDAIRYYLSKKGNLRGYSDKVDINAQLQLNKGLEINIIQPEALATKSEAQKK